MTFLLLRITKYLKLGQFLQKKIFSNGKENSQKKKHCFVKKNLERLIEGNN